MKPKYSYDLNFVNLAIGKHEFNYQVDTSLFETQGSTDFKEVNCSVRVYLNKQERLMSFDFEIDGNIKTICDRCGEELQIDLSVENNLVVRFAEEADFTDDEVIFIKENDTSIDLGQFIYEYIMVGVPTRVVHEEGKCDPAVLRYLEEVSEEEEKKDNELDPRWEALKKFKN